jgi:hypothetical protein
MEDLHVGTLGTSAGIVRPLANLWMTFGGARALWIDSYVQICHQI